MPSSSSRTTPSDAPAEDGEPPEPRGAPPAGIGAGGAGPLGEAAPIASGEPAAHLLPTARDAERPDRRAPLFDDARARAAGAAEPARSVAARDAAPSATEERLGGPRATLLAACLQAVVSAVAAWALLPLPAGGLGVRAMQHVYEAGQSVAVGLVASGAVGLFARTLGARKAIGVALVGALAVALALPVLGEDLDNAADRAATALGIASLDEVVHVALAVLVALGVPAALATGLFLAKRRVWVLGGLAGLAATAANHVVLARSYPGAHVYLAWAALCVLAASLSAAPRRVLPAPSDARLAARLAVGARAALAVWGAFALATWPRSTVLIEMLRSTAGAVLAPFLAELRTGSSRSSAGLDLGPWFQSREGLPPRPPSEPRLVPSNPIVLVLGIDALRPEIVEAHASELPALAALRSRSVEFTMARSPGSQTAYTLATMFTGKYFSQLYWTKKKPRLLWPHEDDSVRFPELLSKAGFETVTYFGAYWLGNAYGILRGFAEETFVRTKHKFTPAAHIAPHVLARLRRHGAAPLFLFVHFLDPHEPYDLAGTHGTPRERYLREVALVDREIERIVATIDEEGLDDRTTIVLMADHGEAFGEHDTTYHANTLYEELLRVPLWIRVPGVAPGRVDHPVSIIDLGPTILDLVGLPTPGHFMGQSLVPFLRGEQPVLDRPIAAEGRLKQALVFPDGTKVIADERRKTLELYDLNRDPLELDNRVDEVDVATEPHVLAFRAFFDAHRIRRKGYKVPYRY